MVKERHPEVQLALVGSMAHDDPEGWEFYNQTVEYAGDDPDIYMFSNLNNVGAVEVNAFQVHRPPCIQKSIREGFGLTVSEALWKARPIVAARVGGIVAQIERRRDRATSSSRRRSAPSALPRDPGRPGRGAPDGPAGQGARAPALPDAAAAARLARAVQPLAGEQVDVDSTRPREMPTAGMVPYARWQTRAADRRLNRGPVSFDATPTGTRGRRRGGGGLVTALAALRRSTTT